MVFGEKDYHPDQSWQGQEMAYKIAYGDVVDIVSTWEWIDFYALRSHLFPAFLSIPLHILRFIGLDTNFLVCNSILFMNSLIQVAGDYFLFLLSNDVLGREGALMTMTYAIVNRRLNEIFAKTLTNGCEAVFCVMGLYYYANLKPKFDRNMALMTVGITVAFIVRSSSLLGWVPLALVKCFTSFDYFVAIITAGILVALPTFAFSVGIDSLCYGRFTCPQLNFVYVNVVDNISKYFGEEPWHYYITELPLFLTQLECFYEVVILGLCLTTVYQINGRLPFDRPGGLTTFPYFVPYIFFNIFVLTLVGHKEQRFMTSIFPLFAIFWAMFWVVLLRVFKSTGQPRLIWLSRLIFKIAFLAYFWEEMFMTIKNQLNYHKGDKEIYTLLHGRSQLLTNYDTFLEQHGNDSDI